MSPSDSPSGGPAVPAPLNVTVSLVLVEALVFVALGISEIASLHGERLALGLTVFAFFLVYGGALAFLALRLRRLDSWARAPIVLAQLLQILVGGSFWGGSTSVVAVLMVVVGLVALAGVFHPASLDALAGED